MRFIKMFGFAIVAAVGAMAFVGASSAMAESTALCSEDSTRSTCPSGKLASHVHYVATGAELLNSSINVTCGILFLGDVSSANLLGAPLVIKGNFSFLGCVKGCEVIDIGEAVFEALKEGTELAKITGIGEVEVLCLGVIECVYTINGVVGHGLGPLVTGDNGHLTFIRAPMEKIGGLLCPPATTLDALFVALPNPLYIRS